MDKQKQNFLIKFLDGKKYETRTSSKEYLTEEEFNIVHNVYKGNYHEFSSSKPVTLFVSFEPVDTLKPKRTSLTSLPSVLRFRFSNNLSSIDYSGNTLNASVLIQDFENALLATTLNLHSNKFAELRSNNEFNILKTSTVLHDVVGLSNAGFDITGSRDMKIFAGQTRTLLGSNVLLDFGIRQTVCFEIRDYDEQKKVKNYFRKTNNEQGINDIANDHLIRSKVFRMIHQVFIFDKSGFINSELGIISEPHNFVSASSNIVSELCRLLKENSMVQEVV